MLQCKHITIAFHTPAFVRCHNSYIVCFCSYDLYHAQVPTLLFMPHFFVLIALLHSTDSIIVENHLACAMCQMFCNPHTRCDFLDVLTSPCLSFSRCQKCHILISLDVMCLLCLQLAWCFTNVKCYIMLRPCVSFNPLMYV